MEAIPLMGKTGFRQVAFEHEVCARVGHGMLTRRIKEGDFMKIPHLDPVFQSLHGILTEVNHSSDAVLFSLVDIHSSILQVKILHPGAQQFTDSHPRP